tara:strand:- start:260 stop:1054 length:795 start_codon:yes stop_codon:yes gene_type:complete
MVDHTSHAQEMRDAFVASMEWWEVAGVGEHVEDAPGAWLRSRDAKPEEAAVVAEKPAAQAPPQPPKRNAVSRFIAADDAGNYPGDPGSWPDDLEAFQKWWMESDAVDPPGSYPRVAPLGSVAAKAMIVLDQPEGEALLAGPASTLAANMLRAMGFAEDQRYLASILPRHALRPDWEALGTAGYGKLLLHHIALARPERVIACGERVWSLLAHETAQEPRALTTIPLDSANIPVFAIPDLPTMLRSSRARAQTWNRWLDWSDSPR